MVCCGVVEAPSSTVVALVAFTVGTTSVMSGAFCLSCSALTSASVIDTFRLCVPPPRPKPNPPAMTVNVLEPSPSSCFRLAAAEPLPTPTRMMTDATPIMMPSVVSAERILFATIPRSAIPTLDRFM